MATVLRDLRLGMRRLGRNAGFTLLMVATIAMGIGLTTGMFSMVKAVLLNPLPFPQADRLVWLHQLDRPGGATGVVKGGLPEPFSYPDFFDIRAQARSYETVSSFRDASLVLVREGGAEHLDGEVVSSDFFRTLGIRPFMGRDFAVDDEKPGTRVVILSHAIWRSKFGSAPNIVGRAIQLDGRQYTVIGVMPDGFDFPIQNPSAALWTTLSYDADGKTPLTTQRGWDGLDVLGRLRPGVPAEAARRELDHFIHRLKLTYPASNGTHTGGLLQPEMEHLTGEARPALRLLFAAVGMLLVIACVNVSGLVLARTLRRRPEIALRLSLGAGRGAIVRQILLESVLLSLLGGALGVLIAEVLLRLALHYASGQFPRLDQVSMDAPVCLFAAVLSILSGLIFGFLPALRISASDPAEILREGSHRLTTGRGQQRLQSGLLIGEIAICLVLLLAASLLIHSFVNILNIKTGFDADNVLTASLDLPAGYSPHRKIQFYEELISRAGALPGVQSAAAGWPTPLSTDNPRWSFEVEGQPTAPGHRPDEALNIVAPGYLRALRIPIVSGRDFTPGDNETGKPVLIVNEEFAQKYFRGQSALGKKVRVDIDDGVMHSPMREIVGVAGNIKHRALTTAFDAQYYLPYAQAVVISPTVFVRTRNDPYQTATALRRQVAAIDGAIPVYRVSTLQSEVTLALSQPRFQTVVFGSFAGLAVVLSAIGLYASLSYTVALRTAELGLRMALGARPGGILALVIGRGLQLAVAGLGSGIAVAAILSRSMRSYLFGVKPLAPLDMIVTILLFLTITLIASALPALRAAKLDPLISLRQQ